ncbi:MAG: hypothetical protein SWH68_16120 [Thermodesulfobacteriota bacterium]|nr:hypothetical protein [Thermodesulfobacteriota bacterium]
MSANFKILKHRNSDNLHLRLVGDFDGTAALELAQTLEDEGTLGAGKIYIHTCNLSTVLPFGEHVFLKSCKLSRGIPFHKLIFTGDFGQQMAPSRAGCIPENNHQPHSPYIH